MQEKINFYTLSLEELQELCRLWNEPAFRAKQLWEWVYQKKKSTWKEMGNIGSSLQEKLEENVSLQGFVLERKEISGDGETQKFLWQLDDGKCIESVLIKAPGRHTVCVSSQVGCPARCAFCASGKEGLIRNLRWEEIFQQVYLIDRLLQVEGNNVSHVVYMGMGEPLENYEAVIGSIRALTDRMGLSSRRITVSTVGVVENIDRLAEEGLSVNLALSLHAPSQTIRKKIIPYARRYELEEVLGAVRRYAKHTKRDITYEYTLLAGINDRKEDAIALRELIGQDPCTVNLIPYNPVQGLHLDRPDKEVIVAFRQLLEEAGIVTTWRYTKGKDIAAACGQLAMQRKPLDLFCTKS